MLDLLARIVAPAGLGAVSASLLAVAVPSVPPASWWDVVVLGIPLGVLAASLAGSSARSFRDESQPDRTLPRRAGVTVIDGFIGGWVAMFLIDFSLTKSYFESMAPPVLGAFGGLLTEYIRSNGARWVEQFYQAFLTWIAKKRAGDNAQ